MEDWVENWGLLEGKPLKAGFNFQNSGKSRKVIFLKGPIAWEIILGQLGKCY